jgi:hypothetical protein
VCHPTNGVDFQSGHAAVALSKPPRQRLEHSDEAEGSWDEAELSISPPASTKILSQLLRLILKERVGALTRERLEAVIVAVVHQPRKAASAVSHT